MPQSAVARPSFPLLAMLAVLALPGGLRAETPAEATRLFEALGMPDLLPIMRQEGLAYGEDLQADLFEGRGGAEWKRAIDGIYDLDRLTAAVTAGLAESLDPAAARDAAAFFETGAGRQIIGYEVAARQALLDEAVEEAASAGWMDLQDQGGPRWDLLRAFESANDLIEQNVAGAMTSNYAFYMGLMEGGAIGFEMTESDILSDVWSQEPAIRDDTTDWVYSFTSLAYQALSDEELAEYVEFSESPVGQALNAALFQTFNSLFADISLQLGRSSARFVGGQDI